MNPIENKKLVLQNDFDIRRQVKGILEDYLGIEKPKELRNQELFYRATNYRGS
jgi:hypothetical protein